nr:recombinase family protein [Clostridium saccharoperbutylacetonicum]
MYLHLILKALEQNLDRQINSISDYCKKHNISIDVNIDIIKEHISGKDFKRERHLTLKEKLLRLGDTLIIKELDRLGRNMEMIKEEWRDLEKTGINIIVIDTEILNTVGKSDLEKKLISNIVFELLSYMAEKERVKIKQRQAEGIAVAKAKGRKLGRPCVEYPGNWKETYDKWKAREITAVKAMELTQLKKNSFYNLVKRYKDEKEQC